MLNKWIGIVSFTSVLLQVIFMELIKFLGFPTLILLVIPIGLLGFAVGNFISPFLFKKKRRLKIIAFLLSSSILISFIAILLTPSSKYFLYSLYISIPFFFIGCIFSFVLSKELPRKAYAYNLFGIALAVFYAVFILGKIGLENTILFLVFLNVFLFFPRESLLVFLFFLLLNLKLNFFDVYSLAQNQDKLIVKFLKDNPNSLKFSSWNMISKTDVIEKNGREFIVLDGAIFLEIYKGSGENIRTLPLYLYEKPKVLVIGSGGGAEIYAIKSRETKKVVAVEINPDIYEITRNKEIFNGVELYNIDGRNYLMKNDEKFDIIYLLFTDTYTIPSFNLMFTENYLYTKEGIEDLINSLGPNGTIFINRWMDEEYLKLLNTFASLTDIENKSILFVQKCVPSYPEYLCSKDVGFLLFKKNGFSQDEKSFLISKLNQKYILENNYSRLILNKNERKKFMDSYAYDITPSTDDKPFFFEFDKKHTFAFFVLWLSIIFSLPLLFFSFKGNPRALLFSSFFGFGYMLFEIITIQKFTLILGSPIYSFLFVLSSLTILGGIGSYFSGRIPLTIAFLFLLISLSFLLMNFIFRIHDLVLNSLLLFIFSFFSGVPFPFVLEKNRKIVNCLTAYNNVFSVIGSTFALFFSVSFGFSFTLFFSLFTYLLAFIIFYGKYR